MIYGLRPAGHRPHTSCCPAALYSVVRRCSMAHAICSRTSGSCVEARSSPSSCRAVIACGSALLPIATAIFRRRPASFARVIALPFTMRRRPASDCRQRSTRRGRSRPSRGCHGASDDVGAGWLYGQTSWQMSHPYTWPPIDARSASGIDDRSSMVRYERQRLESSTAGSTSAPVGHASRQRVQLPHC
jgi:hypothetical protein